MGTGSKLGGAMMQDMRYRGFEDPDLQTPGFGADTMEIKPRPGSFIGGQYDIPQPGYQQPPQGQPDQQGHQQYFQQMHKNMEGMNEALKELEQMQMPGQQYRGAGQIGLFGGGGKGKGGVNF